VIVTLSAVIVLESGVRLTALPPTGFPLASLNVTVIGNFVTPSAVADVELAATCDAPASTGPWTMLTVALANSVEPPSAPVMAALPNTVPAVNAAV
jgi:hypothetical protein